MWSKGRKGQGPGEFNQIRGVAFDGLKHIYFANSSGLQIDRFDLNGDYQISYYLSDLDLNSIALQGFIKPNILIVTQSKTGESGIHITLLELGESLKIKTETDIIEDISFEIPWGSSFGLNIKINADEITVANNYNYEFKYYNTEGRLVKRITRNFNKLVRPGIWTGDNSFAMRIYSSLSAPMKLFDDYYISYSHWPTNLDDPDKYIIQSRNKTAPDLKYRCMLDLLNGEGELLYSIYYDSMNPEIGQPIHVDCDGKLYTTIYDPFPQVRRYKLNINKKN